MYLAASAGTDYSAHEPLASAVLARRTVPFRNRAEGACNGGCGLVLSVGAIIGAFFSYSPLKDVPSARVAIIGFLSIFALSNVILMARGVTLCRSLRRSSSRSEQNAVPNEVLETSQTSNYYPNVLRLAEERHNHKRLLERHDATYIAILLCALVVAGFIAATDVKAKMEKTFFGVFLEVLFFMTTPAMNSVELALIAWNKVEPSGDAIINYHAAVVAVNPYSIIVTDQARKDELKNKGYIKDDKAMWPTSRAIADGFRMGLWALVIGYGAFVLSRVFQDETLGLTRQAMLGIFSMPITAYACRNMGASVARFIAEYEFSDVSYPKGIAKIATFFAVEAIAIILAAKIFDPKVSVPKGSQIAYGLFFGIGSLFNLYFLVKPGVEQIQGAYNTPPKNRFNHR